MATLQDLLSEKTQAQYFQDLMSRHRLNGVPTNTWLSLVNVGLSLTQLAAEALADLRERVRYITSGLFLETATGAALTLLARSQFQLERDPATFALGRIRLISVQGAPPYTFALGDLTVGTPGPSTSATRLYTNTTGGTLQPGSTLDLEFLCSTAGASGSIPTDSPLELKTAYAGVLASNPQIGNTGSWLIVAGQDEEGDDRLKLRCAARWATLGCGGSEDALFYWALARPAGYAASPVAQARVFPNQLNGNFAGAATVVVLGPAGPLQAGDLNAVKANFENPKKYPVGCVLDVKNGTTKAVTLTGTVNVWRNRQSVAEVQAGVAAALAAYQQQLLMGQSVYPQRKVAGIIEDGAPTSIRDVDLSGMAGVITQASTELPVLGTGGLTYTLVDP